MDLIDRQKALAVVSCLGDEDTFTTIGHFERILRALPSEQPEIIRCKDCKWCEDADGSMCKNPASWVIATDRDFGCVLAERRTDGRD